MTRIEFETVESEIRKEKAETLGRAGERLEHALQRLAVFRQELLASIAARGHGVHHGEEQFPVEIEQRIGEYMRLREQANALRHSLIIQREAVGLLCHEDVDRQYPLPGSMTPPGAARQTGKA